jgi:GT2 family glycosyltransferase
MTKASVSIVIVNWNSGLQLADCIESIRSHASGLVTDVIVVDNASTDTSLSLLPENMAELKVIRNEANRGFGAACNQGAARACGTYLLFLNPDTLLYSRSLIDSVAFMDQRDNENVGVSGIALVDGRNVRSRSCSRFPTLPLIMNEMTGFAHLWPTRFLLRHMRDWDHATSCDVDHVIGAFYLIREPLFRSLGGFDERFFVYLEDLDLSLRVRQSGFRIHYLAEIVAYHAGGGTSEQIKGKRLAYSLTSRIQYVFKHFSASAFLLILLSSVTLEPLSRCVMSIKETSVARLRETIEGCGRYFMSLFRLTTWKAVK